MALPARIAISANLVQPGSSSRSQCDLLLGSFQILAASIMAGSPRRIPRAVGLRPLAAPAQVDFLFRVRGDSESGAAQHGLDAAAIRNPPVGRIVGVAVLDEVQLRIVVAIELVGGPEIVIL